MSAKRLIPKVIWLVCFLLILCGFTFQSWGVSTEYFQYRTSTFVAIHDYPDKDIQAPAIAVCFWTDAPNLMGEEPATTLDQLLDGKKNIFNDQNETWRILEGRTMNPNVKLRYHSKKFITRNKYCLLTKILTKFDIENVTPARYHILSYFYVIRMSVTPIHSLYAHAFAQKPCNPKVAFIKIVTDEYVLSNPRIRQIYRELCTEGMVYYFYVLSYTSLVNEKLPPPYDTNCLDYRKEHLMTKDHCYDECLKEKLKSRGNFIPGMAIIELDRYKGSSARILPGKFLEDLEDSMPEYDKKNQKILKELRNLSHIGEKSIPKADLDEYLQVKRQWKGIKQICRRSCSRPDCILEDISPNVYFTGTSIKDNASLSEINFQLVLTHQPTIRISSTPKQHVLDFLTYMCSNLSFWLGFSPLIILQLFFEKFRTWRRRKKKKTKIREHIREEPFIQHLERKVRGLEILLEEQSRTVDKLIKKTKKSNVPPPSMAQHDS